MMRADRLAKLEARLSPTQPRRLIVVTVPIGGTVEDVAEANRFPLLDDDLLVVIQKPEGCPACTMRQYQDAI